MYTIIVNADSSVVASVIEPIRQNSNLAHTLRILVPSEYCGYNTVDFMAVFQYKTPESGAVGAEILKASEKPYKGFIEYLLPLKVSTTKEAGVVRFFMTFMMNSVKNDQKTAIVCKTAQADLMILPEDDYDGALPDDALGIIEEKMLQLHEMQSELRDMQENLDVNKADNIIYKDDTLQLTANGTPIGNTANIGMNWIDV